MRELTKDLENIKGDLAQNYRTIPVVYGENVSKKMLSVLSVATLIPVILLLTQYETGYMNLFFYGSIIALIVFNIMLWKSSQKLHYVVLHNILKLIIVAGVFSIILLNVDVVLSRVF
ncbi:hypothetical protein ULMA_03660 [Patiriisocius marinus]|uniref:Uncharacterized protein n=2 Tax=Patiriisocius marinus TaxID=1397112 RepID=A0A5J4IXF2_9FLAO|nr:hypothetical protein ULMA_03660 [Patiriisocius marinus]